MNKPVIWIIAAIFAVIISLAALLGMFNENKSSLLLPSSYTLVQKWELPPILKEVSDISWIGDSLVAAIQDEEGTVFLYNLASSEIVEKIKFGKPGDYEGMAVHDQTIYVLRSDGKLFEIEDYTRANSSVNEYPLSFTENHDFEGLALDTKNNRLLLAVKEEKDSDKNYKEIYGFDLQSKILQKKPAYTIRFDDPIFKDIQKEEKAKTIRPSEIDFHPSTGKLFVLDAKIPMLVVFDETGKSEKLYFLGEDDFPQPEGLTFDASGNMYISNEGKDQPGNILRVALK